MVEFYENIEDYNQNKQRKILIVFNYIIADMLSNKKLNSNRMIYQRQKIKHFSYFYYTIFLAAPKDIRLNFTHCFIMKIPNKQELKQTASQNSSDIGFSRRC